MIDVTGGYVDALCLVLLSVLLITTATTVVTTADWPGRAPCAALCLWLAGYVGGLSALVCATYGLFAELDENLAHRTLRLPADAAAVGFAWVFIARVVTAYVEVGRLARRRRERHLMLLELFGYAAQHLSAVVLPSRQPLAYSVPGRWSRRGHAVISDVVLAEFTREEVQSVLAHEQAHLRQRHHLLTQLSEALCTTLPRGQFTARFGDRIGNLIEMRADCAARVKCGRLTIAQALARMAPGKSPETAAGSRCPVAARRRHLLTNVRCCSSLTSSVVFGAACVLATAPVALLAVGALAAVCDWICR
ncbi:M56 family metallopeptidase [Streptomyces sp. NPDC006645]|uniref:M56 family metallopeptidase n=1 Tax=unclassified Streptomyces TaxID=2593676 RepID=UPI00339FB71C